VNLSTKLQVVDTANRRRGAISAEKGPEYTGEGKNYAEGDILANFKNVASTVGSSPITVAGVYANKHWDSLSTFIRDLPQVETAAEARALVERGEGIVSRLDDLRNYMDLLECLLVEYRLHPEWSTSVGSEAVDGSTDASS